VGGLLPATATVAVSVAAPPETLWKFVSDPSVCARFSAELRVAGFAAGQSAEVGAVIEGTNGRGDATWSTRSLVVECEAPTRFGWATGDPPAATWTFDVAPAAGGATLTHEVVFHPGVPPLATALDADPEHATEILDARMAEVLASMEAVATGIARLAEGADA